MKRANKIWIVLGFLICQLTVYSSFAQENIKKELPTGKVNKKVDDTKKATPRNKKNIRYIYVKKGKDLLIGNPCAIQVTQKMGFEYSLEDKRNKNFKQNWKLFWHNTGVKAKLLITRGPWWKASVNKQFKQCAIQSGDYRG